MVKVEMKTGDYLSHRYAEKFKQDMNVPNAKH